MTADPASPSTAKRVLVVVIAVVVAIAAARFYLVRGGDERYDTGPEGRVVCYASLDRGFSEPLFRAFRRDTGWGVSAVFDGESTKTVGLTNRLREEAAAPRCDLFWNNEIVNTIRLKRLGLLAEYRPAAAADFPAVMRDPDGTWTGFASRARVLLVNTAEVTPDDEPKTMADFARLAGRRPAWKGRIGLAKPRFGTTATWVAMLRVQDARLRRAAEASGSDVPVLNEDAFRALRDDFAVRVLAGNKQAAEAVGRGELAMAFTDTDDALEEIEAGRPVAMVFLHAAGGGVALIPNTLAVVKGGPSPAGARALVDYLLRPETEIALAEGPSGQYPANPGLVPGRDYKPRGPLVDTMRPMDVDWEAVADAWDDTQAWADAFFADAR